MGLANHQDRGADRVRVPPDPGGGSGPRLTFSPSPVPGWVRLVRRLVWALFGVGFVAMYLVLRFGNARVERGVTLFLLTVAVAAIGLLGMALVEGWLWFRRRRSLQRVLASEPADGSVGVCDWCGGPAGADSIREGEMLFCGPACRAAHAAPRQSIRTDPRDGWRSAVRPKAPLTPEAIPFLREGLDALDRGIARLVELAGGDARAAFEDVAAGSETLAMLAVSSHFAGGVFDPEAWTAALDETEAAVRWAFERAGQPDPLRFNDAFGTLVDLDQIRKCVTNDAPREELGRALLEARRAAVLLRAEIEQSLRQA